MKSNCCWPLSLLAPLLVLLCMLAFLESCDAAASQPVMSSRLCTKMHRIKAGDSCEAAAQQYGVSLEQIYTINHWNAEKCKKLEVGDFICVA